MSGRTAGAVALAAATVAAPAALVAAQEDPSAESGVTVAKAIPYGKARAYSGRAVRLRLDLYRPPARARPRPAMVWVHGGGFRGGDRSHMGPYAQAFAERGYVSATITYRLATSRQIASVGWNNVLRGAQHDAQAAVRWMRRNARRLGVDPRRIFLGGYSAGAVTALRVAHRGHDPGRSGNSGFSSRVRGAISIAGAGDTSAIGRGDAPVLWFHGRRDGVVSFSAARSVCAGARRRGAGCTLVPFAGGHEIVGSESAAIERRTAAWLRRR